QLPLALVQLLRHLDLDAREQVAAAGALQLRRTLALDAQQRPVLRAGLHLHRHRPVGSRHLDGRTERRLRERDRNLDDQVVAAALVQRRGLNTGDDAEVARLDALERILEGEIDLDLDVASSAAAGPTPAGPPPAASEETAEEIAEIAEITDVEIAEVDVAALEAAAPVRRAEGVVLLALLRI